MCYGRGVIERFGQRENFCREVRVENAGKDAGRRNCDERGGECVSLIQARKTKENIIK